MRFIPPQASVGSEIAFININNINISICTVLLVVMNCQYSVFTSCIEGCRTLTSNSSLSMMPPRCAELPAHFDGQSASASVSYHLCSFLLGSEPEQPPLSWVIVAKVMTWSSLYSVSPGVPCSWFESSDVAPMACSVPWFQSYVWWRRQVACVSFKLLCVIKFHHALFQPLVWWALYMASAWTRCWVHMPYFCILSR